MTEPYKSVASLCGQPWQLGQIYVQAPAWEQAMGWWMGLERLRWARSHLCAVGIKISMLQHSF